MPDTEPPRYPQAEIFVTYGENAHAYLAAATRALRKAGASAEEIDTYKAEAMAGDYDALVATTKRWVTVHSWVR